MANRRARFDINLIESYVDSQVERIADSLEDDMREIVQGGAEDMQRVIDSAVTATGERRVASGAGAHAGRRESDEMYNDVDFEVERRGRGTVIGRYGWIKNYQDYYGIQEDGSQNIEGMDAIGQSFARAEDRLRGVVARVR